jgi:hypothetical protein
MTAVYKLYGSHHGSDELPDFLGEFATYEAAEALLKEPDELMEMCCFDFYIIRKEIAGLVLTSWVG